MPPKKQYANSLLTSPNSSTASKYLPGGTPKPVGGGGGGSWGLTKPVTPVNNWSGTKTTDNSTLTVGSNKWSPFTKPSQAWQDYGKTLSLGTDANGKTTVTQKPPVTPSNVSGTGTTGPTLPPSGKTYAQQLSDITAGANNLQSAFNEYKKGQSTPEEEYKNSVEYKAYLKYMREQQNPTEANNTAKERADALKVLADVQKRKEEADTEARRRYEEILDKSGGLKAGAEQAAGLDRRRSNQELADISLQESAAARTAGVYDDIYQNEQQANRALTIEEAMTLGVPFGTTMSQATAMGKTPTATGSVDEMLSVAEAKALGVPYGTSRSQAYGTETNGTESNPAMNAYRIERAGRILSAVDDVLADTNGWTAGIAGWALSKIPGSAAYDLRASIDEITSNIGFQELADMRAASPTGGALGSIAVQELEMLQAVLGNLKTAQSPEQLKKNLQGVKEHYSNWLATMNEGGGGSGEINWDNI